MIGFLRGFARATALLIWIITIAGTLSLFVLIGFKPHHSIQFFFRGACWIIGIKIKKINDLSDKKPLLLIGNHLSYLDIFVMGALINPSFLAKSEIKKWFFIGFLTGRVAGNFFIDRRPSKIKSEKERLHKAFQKLKRPLLFFPEGTTSNGQQILPFKTPLFDLFIEKDLYIQPLLQKYTHCGNRPLTTEEDHDIYTWWRDEHTLLPHFWQMIKQPRGTLVIKFLPPINVKGFSDRKILSTHLQESMEKEFKKL